MWDGWRPTDGHIALTDEEARVVANTILNTLAVKDQRMAEAMIVTAPGRGATRGPFAYSKRIDDEEVD